MTQALPILLAACSNPDADLRQCAVYGLGILAQHRSAAFQAIAAPALKAITDIIRAPHSRCVHPFMDPFWDGHPWTLFGKLCGRKL